MSNQPKVATRTRDLALKTKKILKALDYYPEGATPKMLALDTGINVNTVKSILPKVKGLEKPLRGLYKVVKEGDGPISLTGGSLFDWNFHNLVLSTGLGSFPGKLVMSTHSFGLVNAEFVLSTVGNASLRVSSDHPLNVSSICFVDAFFRELIAKYSDDVVKTVWVKTIEFNKDYDNLRLDGVKSITVDNLVDQFKLYQKKRGLRLEHKTKVPFSVDNIVDMLSRNPNSLELNIKLSQQAEQIDRLTQQTINNTELVRKLIEVLR